MLGFCSFARVRMPHCYSVLRLFLSSMTVPALCCGHHCCAAAMAWRISKGSAVNLRAAHICLDKAHRLFLPHCWKVMNQQTGQRSHGSTGSCFFLGLTILFSSICIRWHSELGPCHYDRMGSLWNHQQLIYLSVLHSETCQPSEGWELMLIRGDNNWYRHKYASPSTLIVVLLMCTLKVCPDSKQKCYFPNVFQWWRQCWCWYCRLKPFLNVLLNFKSHPVSIHTHIKSQLCLIKSSLFHPRQL